MEKKENEEKLKNKKKTVINVRDIPTRDDDGNYHPDFIKILELSKNPTVKLVARGIPYSEFPRILQLSFLKNLIASILVFCIGVGLTIFKVVTPIFLIAVIPTALFFAYNALAIYMTVSNERYIEFIGNVVNTSRKGFLSQKHYLVQVLSDDKILGFRYYGKEPLTRGQPITLYISKVAPIIQTENGSVIESILGYELSVPLEKKHATKKGALSVNDLFENN